MNCTLFFTTEFLQSLGDILKSQEFLISITLKQQPLPALVEAPSGRLLDISSLGLQLSKHEILRLWCDAIDAQPRCFGGNLALRLQAGRFIIHQDQAETTASDSAKNIKHCRCRLHKSTDGFRNVENKNSPYVASTSKAFWTSFESNSNFVA